MSYPLLYEINTRCWLRGLSERLRQPITLGNVPEAEFAGWERCGFTHLWLMGVWTGGPRARAEALISSHQRQAYTDALPDWSESDVIASPYAIADYMVPPTLGGEEGLRSFRERLHARGLKLVLDFVPNHLGLDHPWVRERPELFVQRAEGIVGSEPEGAVGPRRESGVFLEQTAKGSRWLMHGKDPYFPGWTDTVQLDYRRTETREAMAQLLQSVAARCDGVRCDMAMLLLNDVFAKTWANFPVAATAASAQALRRPSPETATSGADRAPDSADGEFWSAAISQVKQQKPDFIFLAEAYWGTEARLEALGFDYTYDKVLYDKLVAGDAAGTQEHLLGLSSERLARGAHFLENHDEPRVAALLSPAEHRAAALVVLGLPGLRLLHEGQPEGARRRLPVQLGRRSAEPVQAEIRKMYDQLLSALKVSGVGEGTFELVAPRPAWPGNLTARNFVVARWQREGPGFDLVVVNLAPHRSQCRAPLRGTAEQAKWSLEDRLGPERYVRDGTEMQEPGLYLDLPAHGAQLFELTPVRG